MVTTKETNFKDGEFTESRKQLHSLIINSIISSGKRSDKPKAIIMGGGIASGKSSLGELWINYFNDIGRPITYIDCDAIKKLIPEYKNMIKVNPYNAAVLVHDESSDIAEMIRSRCIEEKLNFIYDGTMKNYEKYFSIIESLKDNGYHITLTIVDAPLEIALKRAKIRFRDTGRYVPQNLIEESHKMVPENFYLLKDLAHEYTLYDTSGLEPDIILEKTNEYTEIYHASKLESFYAKSELDSEELANLLK